MQVKSHLAPGEEAPWAHCMSSGGCGGIHVPGSILCSSGDGRGVVVVYVCCLVLLALPHPAPLAASPPSGFFTEVKPPKIHVCVHVSSWPRGFGSLLIIRVGAGQSSGLTLAIHPYLPTVFVPAKDQARRPALPYVSTPRSSADRTVSRTPPCILQLSLAHPTLFISRST